MASGALDRPSRWGPSEDSPLVLGGPHSLQLPPLWRLSLPRLPAGARAAGLPSPHLGYGKEPRPQGQ